MTALRRALRFCLVMAVLVLGARVLWRREVGSPLRPPDAPPAALVIPPGTSAEAIGRLLEQQGLVRRPFVFRALILLRGIAGQLKAGEYAIEGPVTLEQVADMIARGDVIRREVTIPEGRNMFEIAGIFGDQGVP